jgi:hypothetical protein
MRRPLALLQITGGCWRFRFRGRVSLLDRLKMIWLRKLNWGLTFPAIS